MRRSGKRKLPELFFRANRIGKCYQEVQPTMYCPKCGLQNPDETKYCRGCRAVLSSVLAKAEGRDATQSLAEKYIEVRSRGIRGMLTGIGFSIISIVLYGIPPQTGVFWVFLLMFAFFWFAAGISRLIEARGLKALIEPPPAPILAQHEYDEPTRNPYDTDELTTLPPSVTEHTTTHLHLDPEAETISVPKK